MAEELVLVWKIPRDTIDTDAFHEVGIYPSGELMGICESEEDAECLIEILEEHSPSERFGGYEDPTKNSFEDAPYEFAVSYQRVWDGR